MVRADAFRCVVIGALTVAVATHRAVMLKGARGVMSPLDCIAPARVR
jgi:hypothetical protein